MSRKLKRTVASDVHICKDGKIVSHSEMSDSHIVSLLQNMELWAERDRNGADPAGEFPEYTPLLKEAQLRKLL